MSYQSSTIQSTVSNRRAGRRTQVVVLALLFLLIAFHLLNNQLWLATNEVVYGFDRMTHQVASLQYHDILRQGVNVRTLFTALTISNYYPPLVHLTAVAFCELFGVSMDVAAMSNSIYLVLFLLAVYGLGERLAGSWVGLLSALIVSTFPIVFSMSRYLYVDFALTSMVALNICLLLRSDRFARKGYTLLYGLSLGLGMLTKWTFAAFAAAPLLVMLASSGVWRAIHPAAWSRRRLLVAGLLGLSLTAVWFVPNVAATAALPLGYALVPLSWLLWSVTWYFVLAPPVVSGAEPPVVSGAEPPVVSGAEPPVVSGAEPPAVSGAEPPERGRNLLAALGLGLTLASSWYLTNISFVTTFWLNAYGKPTGRSWGFVRYLDFLYREQLSPLYATVLLVAILGLVWSRRRSPLALGEEGWALVLWVVVPYIIFSSRVSIVHSRYIVPLLPPLGIAIALWLSRIRPHWARALLTDLVIAGALVQFAALSFDALAGLRERVLILANGLSIQLPASGRTDPGYWAAPEILQYVEEHRDTESAQLGVLVNKPQVNSMHFAYLAYADYRHVQAKGLATVGWTHPAYPRLFECDFVLLIDPPPHYARRPDTVATLERLLNTPDDTFHRAFELAETYPLPDGNRLHVYQRRFASLGDPDLAYYEALMADLRQVATSDDGVVLTPPEQVYALARYGDGSLPLYPLPSEPRPLSEADTATLSQLGAEHSRLWVVLGNTGQVDPGGLMARWLAGHLYRANNAWYGPLQLMLYAPEAQKGSSAAFQESHTTWQGGITLRGYRFLDHTLPLGQILRLEMQWQATKPISERYKVFVHLLSEGGQVVAQRDSEPVAGTCPTTEWQPGQLVADRYGLWLAAGPSGQALPPGDYQIVVGLYHPETGERLSDAIPIARVRVEGETAFVLALDGN